jgi:hypothetical protein
MKKAKTVSISVWMHLQCGYKKCAGWWAIENGGNEYYFCPHCGRNNQVEYLIENHKKKTE